MLGSPFSPWYYRARVDALHAADPVQFASFNVALYSPRGSRWALHEAACAGRSAESVRIGGSTLAREGDRLTIAIDAPGAAPRFGRVRGKVSVDARDWNGEGTALDADGRHSWRTYAPRARVEVHLDEPRISFRGWGYVDGNAGDEPLENAFQGWTWSRAHLPDGRTLLGYETKARDGEVARVARLVHPSGGSRTFPFETASLPKTFWGLPRTAHATSARLVRTLEDTPFYSRSLVEVETPAGPAVAMHETLSLDRFVKPWVRFLLPFRMRREAPR